MCKTANDYKNSEKTYEKKKIYLRIIQVLVGFPYRNSTNRDKEHKSEYVYKVRWWNPKDKF